MTPSAIYDALLTRCGTLPGPYPTSYPNQSFTPPPDAPYLQAEVFPNRPRWQALGPGRMDQGLLQITIVSPIRDGLIPIAEIADVVLAHFPKGQKFDGVRVSGEPWVAQPIIEASEIRLPVTIPWSA